jgi:uncharacterized protein RhaS with RHS repeats
MGCLKLDFEIAQSPGETHSTRILESRSCGRSREYDPSTGSWMPRDPILFEGGDTNLYGYTLQDPINGIDPDGERSFGLVDLADVLIKVGTSGYATYQYCTTSGTKCPQFTRDIICKLGGPCTQKAPTPAPPKCDPNLSCCKEGQSS